MLLAEFKSITKVNIDLMDGFECVCVNFHIVPTYSLLILESDSCFFICDLIEMKTAEGYHLYNLGSSKYRINRTDSSVCPEISNFLTRFSQIFTQFFLS